jgi:hypothetical protein
METQSSLIDAAKSILKTDYHFIIPIWLANAGKGELKGLKLIQIIIKNQGLKKFRPTKKKSLRDMTVMSKHVQKVQSQYSEAFSENVIQKVFESEVFKFMKLSDLPISKTLKPESLMFLERWLELDDSDHYRGLMLLFLRSFYGVSVVNLSLPISTTREIYSRKKIEKIPLHGRKKFYNKNPSFKLPEITRTNSLSSLNLKNTFAKDIKSIVCRDHKDLTKWVSPINGLTTAYQENFHTRSIEYIPVPKKDIYRSVSIKLLPSD